jgi:hypothetical protein
MQQSAVAVVSARTGANAVLETAVSQGAVLPVAPVANWDSVAALRAPVLRHRPDHRWIGPSVVHTQAAFMLPRR